MSSDIRVRFAPSPTGFLHVGNARTALYNWLFARATGGTFVLRIDDTDQKRSTAEAVDMAIRSLKWLGLDWDEGPEIGGSYGPYFQSERLDIYKEHINRLLDEGKAYYCFCSSEELEMKSKAQKALGQVQVYDGKCKNIGREEAEERIAKGEQARIRFVCPDKPVNFEDHVRGKIKKEAKEIGDVIIYKEDGYPTYNFATVIDEALMKITHVIRGEDHISNTPRQILLFEAFGYQAPVYVHTSTILGSDREKLSKRHGSTTLIDFKDEGYLPEAMRNFMALLGWSHPEAVETLKHDELVKAFTIDRFSKSPAVFDKQKFDYINGWHIRNAELEHITKEFMPHLISGGYIKEDYSEEDLEYAKRLTSVVRDYCSKLTDINEHVKIFFSEELNFDDAMKEELKNEDSKRLLEFIKDEISALEKVDEASAKAIIKKAQKELGLKGKKLYHPIRIGVTAQNSGADLAQIFDLLGKDRILKRLDSALNAG